MSASINDKVTDTRNAARPVTTTASSPRSSGGVTLSCASLTGWPTASKVHFVTYQVDSNSVPISGTQLDCYGIVSGSNITSFTVVDGTDNGNSVGDKVEMLPTSGWGQDLSDALLVGHTRAGAHASSLPLTSPVLTTPTIADYTNALFSTVLGLSNAIDPSNGLLSQANAGTAGGTMYYINLGGIKMLWMITAAQNVGTGGATWTVTLPTSFFSTLQYVAPSIYIIATEPKQHVYISGANTTTITIGQISDTNGATQQTSLLVIGT